MICCVKASVKSVTGCGDTTRAGMAWESMGEVGGGGLAMLLTVPCSGIGTLPAHCTTKVCSGAYVQLCSCSFIRG